MLKAYFDCSADREQKYFLTLGGIVASGIPWEKFQEQWQSVLKPYGLTFFHMAPAMAIPPQDQFKGWPREKIDVLVKALLKRDRQIQRSRLSSKIMHC